MREFSEIMNTIPIYAKTICLFPLNILPLATLLGDIMAYTQQRTHTQGGGGHKATGASSMRIQCLSKWLVTAG